MIITKQYLKELIKEELENVVKTEAIDTKKVDKTPPSQKTISAPKQDMFGKIAKALGLERGRGDTTDVSHIVVPGTYAIMAAVADVATGGHVTQSAIQMMQKAGIDVQQGVQLAMDFVRQIAPAVGLEEGEE